MTHAIPPVPPHPACMCESCPQATDCNRIGLWGDILKHATLMALTETLETNGHDLMHTVGALADVQPNPVEEGRSLSPAPCRCRCDRCVVRDQCIRFALSPKTEGGVRRLLHIVALSETRPGFIRGVTDGLLGLVGGYTHAEVVTITICPMD